MNKFISGVLAVALMLGNTVIFAQASSGSADTVTSATAKTTAPTSTAKPAEQPKPATTKTTEKPKTTTAPKPAATPKTGAANPATTPAKPAPANPAAQAQQKQYEDGIYRGTYSDNNEMQVGLEFELKANKVVSIKFRHLMYKGKDYKNEKEDQTIITLTKQYNALLTHLVNKDIRTELKALYKPGEIVKDSGVDGVSGATLRSGKLISSINDALNRGVYSYPSAK